MLPGMILRDFQCAEARRRDLLADVSHARSTARRLGGSLALLPMAWLLLHGRALGGVAVAAAPEPTPALVAARIESSPRVMPRDRGVAVRVAPPARPTTRLVGARPDPNELLAMLQSCYGPSALLTWRPLPLCLPPTARPLP